MLRFAFGIKISLLFLASVAMCSPFEVVVLALTAFPATFWKRELFWVRFVIVYLSHPELLRQWWDRRWWLIILSVTRVSWIGWASPLRAWLFKHNSKQGVVSHHLALFGSTFLSNGQSAVFLRWNCFLIWGNLVVLINHVNNIRFDIIDIVFIEVIVEWLVACVGVSIIEDDVGRE